MCPCGPLQRQSFSPPTAFRCLQRFGAGAGCGRGIRRWLERVRPPAPATACNASPDSAAVYVRRRRPGGTGGGGSGAAGGSRSCCQHDPGGYDARGAWIWPSQLRRWAGGKKSVGVRAYYAARTQRGMRFQLRRHSVRGIRSRGASRTGSPLQCLSMFHLSLCSRDGVRDGVRQLPFMPPSTR